MTLYLTNIKASIKEMEDLFDNATQLSVRYYEPSKKNQNNFDITIRCNEDVAKQIRRKRTAKSILKYA